MFEILPNWHPVFVHFTVALLVVAAALHLLSHFVTNPRLVEQWTATARWNLWIGVGATALTIAAGMYAYYTVDHDTPSHAAMTVHRNWALVTTLVFLVVVGLELWLARQGRGKSWLFTGLLGVAAVLLLTTAWHGGELVYRHGLGVQSLPQSQGPGHAHDHGDGDGHRHGDAAPAESSGHDSLDHDHDGATDAPAQPADAEQKKGEHSHAPGAAPHDH
jgi:uncharacterized membrane protein